MQPVLYQMLSARSHLLRVAIHLSFTATVFLSALFFLQCSPANRKVTSSELRRCSPMHAQASIAEEHSSAKGRSVSSSVLIFVIEMPVSRGNGYLH